MIRTAVRALAAAAALAAAPAAWAQQTGPQQLRLGFGVGYEPFAPFNLFDVNARAAAPGVGLYMPIQIGQHLRIEPSLSIFTFSQNPANDLSAVALGTGVFYYFAPAQSQQVGLYAGGRLNLFFLKNNQANPVGPEIETKETDLQLAAVLGGEYFVAPRFSVGAEAQLGLTWYGDQDVSGQPSVSRDAFGLSTNGVIFLRFFFH